MHGEEKIAASSCASKGDEDRRVEVRASASAQPGQEGFSGEDVKRYRDMFHKFDSDGDGRLSRHELVAAFLHMGFSMSFRKAKSKTMYEKSGPGAEVEAESPKTPVAPKLFVNLPSGENVDLRELFDRLDADHNGKISKKELERGAQMIGITSRTQIEKLLEAADTDQDSLIDFNEFLRYVSEHQKKLKLVFEQLDVNSDGQIDVHEIRAGLAKLGVKVSQEEATQLLKKVKTDSSTTIDWDEWRNFHLFHPTSDVKEIVEMWRTATHLDVGEDLRIPDEDPAESGTFRSFFNTFVAGGLAGAVSRTATAPLDRIKVLLQVHASQKNPLGLKSGLKQLIQEGGFQGLWRGNGMNVIKIAPESAIKFMAFEKMKSIVKRGDGEITVVERFLAGSSAGLISQSTIYPMELLKTKMALRRTGEYSGLLDCAKTVYREGGLRVFYRGYLPNVLGIIPYAGIDLAVYETLKMRYMARQRDSSEDSRRPGVLVLLGCGAVSSSCGQLASYPLALIRTKMQDTTSSGKRQPSMGQLFAHIWRTEGVFGLYHGILPNFLKVIPAVSISYVVYENARSFLKI